MTSPIKLTLKELTALAKRVDQKTLREADWEVLQEVFRRFYQRQIKLQERQLANLNQVKADHSPLQADESRVDEAPPLTAYSGKDLPSHRKDRPKGHGKRAYTDYSEADHKHYKIAGFQNGQKCKECSSGRMYQERERRIIRIVGQLPFSPEVHHIEAARCRHCGAKLEADCPLEVVTNEIAGFDYMACSLLIVMHYLAGIPFKRLEQLQAWFNAKVSDSRLWDAVDQVDAILAPVFKVFENQVVKTAATVRFDDTGAYINNHSSKGGDERAINTSTFYFDCPSGIGVLYYTGPRHAGENFEQLLKLRTPESAKLVVTTDAAAKNFCYSQKEKVTMAACNAHAFRKFKEQKENYPEEYAYVATIYQAIYEHDEYCRKHHYSPQARLRFHQEHSGALVDRLLNWVTEKIRHSAVEGEPKLNEALGYIANHIKKLTEFLRTPGVPLDTNLVEQVIKTVIRYRKNSRAYATGNGAETGDRMMSLAQSVVAGDESPFAYFYWCLIHKEQIAREPTAYTPFAYIKLCQEKSSALVDSA